MKPTLTEFAVDARSGVRYPKNLQTIDVSRLVIAPWNPNRMPPKKLTNLVANMKEVGFIDPIKCVYMAPGSKMLATYVKDDDGEPWYLIIDGAHRYESGRLLDMEVIPAIIHENFDDDLVKLQNVRSNVLRGKMDEDAFAKLWVDLRERYPEELLKEQMGLVEEREFKALVKDIAADLPPTLKKKFEKAASMAASPADLERILNELLTKSADTRELGYMIFDFEGKTHYWVGMPRVLKVQMEKLDDRLQESRKSLTDVLSNLLLQEEAVDLALSMTDPQPDVEF